MKPDVKGPSIPPRLILGGNHLIVITKKCQALIKSFYICNCTHNNDYVQIFNITLKDM